MQTSTKDHMVMNVLVFEDEFDNHLGEREGVIEGRKRAYQQMIEVCLNTDRENKRERRR